MPRSFGQFQEFTIIAQIIVSDNSKIENIYFNFIALENCEILIRENGLIQIERIVDSYINDIKFIDLCGKTLDLICHVFFIYSIDKYESLSKYLINTHREIVQNHLERQLLENSSLKEEILIKKTIITSADQEFEKQILEKFSNLSYFEKDQKAPNDKINYEEVDKISHNLANYITDIGAEFLTKKNENFINLKDFFKDQIVS